MENEGKKSIVLAVAIFYIGFAWALAYYTVTALPQSEAVVKALVTGTAPLPHQLRALGPWTIGLFIKTGLFSQYRAELFFYFCAYLFAIIALGKWLELFLPKFIAQLSPVWLFVALLNQMIFHYPCDALTIGFASLAFYFAVKKNLTAFLITFALATLNKETTYLALFAVLALNIDFKKWQINRGSTPVLLAGILIFAVVELLLFSIYKGNDGGILRWKLFENIQLLTGHKRPWDFENFSSLSTLGLPFVWLNILAIFNFLWILIFPNFHHKSPELKRLGWVIMLQLLLLLNFANVWEKRAFLELLPLILPLALQTFFLPDKKKGWEQGEPTIPSLEGRMEGQGTGDRGQVSGKNKQFPVTCCLIPVTCICAWAMAYYTLASLPENPGMKIGDLIAGRADLPFQYRVLGPWIISAFQSSIFHDTDHAQLLFYFLAYLFAFVSMRLWLSNFLPKTIAELSPLFLMSATVNNLIFRYPWDVLTLGFIPLLLHLAYRKSWTWFVIAFLIGTFNRETTYLALLAVFLFHLKLDLRELKSFAIPVAISVMLWIATKLLLASMYSGNQGEFLEWKPYYNFLLLLGKSSSWDFHEFIHLSGFKLPFIWLIFLSWANFWWVFILPNWKHKTPVLKRLGWLIVVHLILSFLLGNLWERRIFLEIYPIVIGLGLETFTRRGGDER